MYEGVLPPRQDDGAAGGAYNTPPNPFARPRVAYITSLGQQAARGNAASDDETSDGATSDDEAPQDEEEGGGASQDEGAEEGGAAAAAGPDGAAPRGTVEQVG
ncbi:hypothetical protein MNEG_16208 [Monoraphidium neglectum]|uniref:Uncharacterized protein n=1 Tax=Monoraphidium neglectum TaxID=145388 RepID=A0A0D2M8I6_9CHLO|nr:hypothetical protein MNEG_16208 [Monoraphidium neglectum]KIY91755.1 hypothetical protein MNEG_16208 [Monoraphidium neglectum]|eukprot:XP_013890775.1 hypothetical protein MNEG_16208 [Monoraphidium neglectum]